MKLLHEEPREKLQLFLLKSLQCLASTVSHLWTDESLASLVTYIEGQRGSSQLLLVRSSQILCTLARQANPFFLFLFDDHSAQRRARFESLLESMLFHENKQVAFSFNSLATHLLVMHAQNKHAPFLDRIFDSTKTGLFAIVLECDRQAETNANTDTSLLKVITSFR
jgi:hypothetical protein